MTRQREAAIWREIGAGFERLLPDGPPQRCVLWMSPFFHGLCYAAQRFGLPSYENPGARVPVEAGHGPYVGERGAWRVSASWRALSAYLIAEMIEDDAAWCVGRRCTLTRCEHIRYASCRKMHEHGRYPVTLGVSVDARANAL